MRALVWCVAGKRSCMSLHELRDTFHIHPLHQRRLALPVDYFRKLVDPQMLHERLLLPLSSLRLSDCPSKAAAALTCIAALLQHTAGLPAQLSMPPPSQQHPPSDVLLLCGEMGRACDAACVSVLLDLMTDPTATGGGFRGFSLFRGDVSEGPSPERGCAVAKSQGIMISFFFQYYNHLSNK